MPTIMTIKFEANTAVILDISSATFNNISFNVTSQETNPTGLALSPNGTKMFVTGTNSNEVHQYTLSTGFDLSTASFDNVSVDVSVTSLVPQGVTFSSDGTKMFVLMSTDIHQYSLSTGFDLSTASFDNVVFSIAGQDTAPREVIFNPTGTKMFAVGANTNSVYQYSLSTGFDLTTAGFDSVVFSIAGQDTNAQGLMFSQDGTRMFVSGIGSGSVHQYSLSTGFDLSTASFDSISFDVSNQDVAPAALAFNVAGTKMFVLGGASDNIFQYTL